MPICSLCEKPLGRDAFSKNQLSKKAARRCKGCVAKAEAVEASIERVKDVLISDGSLTTDPTRAASLKAAADRPATKTAPLGFDTAEEAEAAGWRWHPGRCVWIDGNTKGDSELKNLERSIEEQYTREILERMDLTTLGAELEMLRSVRPLSPNNSGKDDLERSAMIDEIVVLASEIHAATRDRRKQKSGAESKTPVIMSCSKCLKPAEAGMNLQMCSRCKMTQYCSKQCQVSHWPEHKKECKKVAKYIKSLEQEGVDLSGGTEDEILRWYAQVPNLASDVAALAWKFRANQPVIKVVGGANARLAEVQVLTKEMWTISPLAEEYSPRFKSATFDPNRHYFATICRDMDRSDLPVLTPRFQFPLSAELMDSWVAEQDAVRRNKQGGSNEPVRNSAGGTRKQLGHAWKCDACNETQESSAYSTYWYAAQWAGGKHGIGDLAICDACTEKGVTAETVAQKMGCCVQ